MAISLEDQIAIERLMYRYARCADNKDYSGFHTLFCEDAVFEYRGEPVVGIAAIVELMHNLENYTTTLHLVQNVLFEVVEDSAEGQTYCLASHLCMIDGREMKIDMGIIYTDTLLRSAEGWRIQRREFKPLWTQTLPTDA